MAEPGESGDSKDSKENQKRQDDDCTDTPHATNSVYTENAQVLVKYLLGLKLQGQSIWLRSISRDLDLDEKQVVEAVKCLRWDTDPTKWLVGGKTAARLEIRDPIELVRLAASFDGTPSSTSSFRRKRPLKFNLIDMQR